MALAYTNTKVEIREISLKDRPQELYDASSKGTVPVIITIDEDVIDESLEIMLWALKNKDKQEWLSEDCSIELDIINKNDTLFKKWLDRYKYHDRYPERNKEFYREKCEKFLHEHENQLHKTNFLLYDNLNIVDVALFPFIRQFANVNREWFSKHYPNLDHWLESWIESTLFNSIMNKYEQWEPKDKPLIIDFT